MRFIFFDFLIGISFSLSFIISFMINRHLKKEYSEKFKHLIKELFNPSHNQDKKYKFLINLLRINLIIMVASICGKAISFIINK